MPPARPAPHNPLSDAELLDAIMRDLRTVYSDIIKQPLPDELAAALQRLKDRTAETPANVLPVMKIRIGD